jgi:hypothetical protein
VYAKCITATGWTWEYLDEFVTLPRLNALLDHWATSPPVHITAALFAGVESRRDSSRSTVAANDAVKPLDNASLVANMHADPRTLTWVNKVNG